MTESPLSPEAPSIQVRTCYDRDGLPVEVRPFRETERSALTSFYEAFEPKRAAQGLPPSGAERVRKWLDSILPRGIHLLAWAGAELIGHALLIPTSDSEAAEYAVFLRVDMRGRGLGTQLNQLAVETARERGFRRIWLSVVPHNRAAIRSYEKVGFRFLPGTIYSPEAEMQLDL